MESLRTLVIGLAIALTVPAASAQAPSRAEVATRVARHDDAAALEALRRLPDPERSTAPVRVLEARLLERLGRLEEARDRWLAIDLGTIPPALVLEMRLRIARLEARTGRFADARRRALEVATDARSASIGTSARALAAESALALGRAETALSELDALRSTRSGALDATTIARSAARALLALGRRDEAATRLRDAILASPGHPDRASLVSELAAIDPARAAFGFDERIAIAAALVDARAYDAAIAELDRSRATTDVERAALAHARAAALFGARRYAEAIPVFDRAIAGRATTAIDDAYSAARAANRVGDADEAKRRFAAFVAANRTDSRLTEARFAIAAIDLERGDRRAMEALANDTHVARATRSEAAIAVGLDRLARGEAEAARAMFGIGCPLAREEATRLACRYFGAIAALEVERDRSIATLEALAAEQRDAHYGLLARRRLTALGRTVPAAAPAAATAPVPASLPESVSFYAGLGLVEDAADQLERLEGDAAFAGDSGRIQLVAGYLALEDYGRAFRIARASRSLPDAVVRAATYPRPFADAVEPLAERLRVDPFYVYGTMRQESGFRADAVSRVGAIGILQMMPTTAARAAERAGLSDFEPTALFAPRTSVGLALVEMGTLRERYGGCLPLVAAAYNAGVAKVDAWLETRRGWPIDLFLEAIPFDETRGYVRRVIGHTAAYHALDGAPDRGPSLYDRCEEALTGRR